MAAGLSQTIFMIAAFLQGKVSIYQWVGEGSSYFLSDIFAALTNVQLDQIIKINKDRQYIATQYTKAFKKFSTFVQLPYAPIGMTKPNWHIYAFKFQSVEQRKVFVQMMRKKGIEVSTHYVPLHTAPMGIKMVKKVRSLPVTDEVASTLVRMPIYAGMSKKELHYVITTTVKIFQSMVTL